MRLLWLQSLGLENPPGRCYAQVNLVSIFFQFDLVWRTVWSEKPINRPQKSCYGLSMVTIKTLVFFWSLQLVWTHILLRTHLRTVLLAAGSQLQEQVLRMTLVKPTVLVTVTFLADSTIKEWESESVKPWHSGIPPHSKNLPTCMATSFYSEVNSGLFSSLAFDMQEKLMYSATTHSIFQTILEMPSMGFMTDFLKIRETSTRVHLGIWWGL